MRHKNEKKEWKVVRRWAHEANKMNEITCTHTLARWHCVQLCVLPNLCKVQYRAIQHQCVHQTSTFAQVFHILYFIWLFRRTATCISLMHSEFFFSIYWCLENGLSISWINCILAGVRRFVSVKAKNELNWLQELRCRRLDIRTWKFHHCSKVHFAIVTKWNQNSLCPNSFFFDFAIIDYPHSNWIQFPPSNFG